MKNFVREIVLAFRKNMWAAIPQPPSMHDKSATIQQTESLTRLKVSLNDLKIISSALLHLKKVLLKKNDLARAKAVAEVDERIYRIICAIEEQPQEEQHLEKAMKV